MCGIIGFFDFENAPKLVVDGLKLIKNRGLDGFGVASDTELKHEHDVESLQIAPSNQAIGHNLHSVVGFRPQPLQSDSQKFAINCEIYNWKDLNEKYSFNAENDSEVVFKLLQVKGIDAIEELDGVFAFVWWNGNDVYLARDLIGIKPLWYSLDERLAFSSEKKVLMDAKLQNIEELNPRVIIKYNTETKATEVIKRKFFEIFPEHESTHDEIIEKVKELTIDAIKKRIPDKPFGILFSGGIDSTFIALVCKQLGYDFTCYTAALESYEDAQDLVYAKKAAEALGLKLKYKTITLEEMPSYLEKVVPLIEDTNVTKVGVGITFYIACELAKEDNIKVIFSGLGSEEIFAGYDRHKKARNINEECLSGVRKIYERDMYRDDVITMNNNLELRLPFLDKALSDYSLKIPEKFKIVGEETKVILRDVAAKLGLEEEFAKRPKKAAQYGSKFDRGLIKLTRKAGLKYRSEYLRDFYPYANLKLAALVSGGKDSIYAMHIMQKQNYEITCFVTINSKNKDSYMYHTPNISMAELQAKACDIPIIVQDTIGKKEEELKELEIALQRAKEEYGIDGVCNGALFSNYQRERIEKVCDKLGLKIFSPLWHMNQELEMRNLIEEGFEVIFSSIAADGLNKTWLGKSLTFDDVDKLVAINKRIGMNCAGEGGEYESLVLDGPMFKQKIEIIESNIEMENEITGRFNIVDAKLSE